MSKKTNKRSVLSMLWEYQNMTILCIAFLLALIIVFVIGVKYNLLWLMIADLLTIIFVWVYFLIIPFISSWYKQMKLISTIQEKTKGFYKEDAWWIYVICHIYKGERLYDTPAHYVEEEFKRICPQSKVRYSWIKSCYLGEEYTSLTEVGNAIKKIIQERK